ncbi:hypothetical protein DRN74_01920 [Candidatus Micrarchaeota archaeon]|nr:MAG: hypothetical protein DRN74_01920 [Candidatus Micrarchaeota archaeon]
MHELIERALKYVDEVEISRARTSSKEFKMLLNSFEVFEAGSYEAFTLRIINKGHIGFSYFEKAEQFSEALRRAIKLSKFSKKINPHFPERQRYRKVKVYHNSLEKADEHFVESLSDAVSVFDKGPVRHIQSRLSLSFSENEIVNSNGLEMKRKESLLSFLSSANSKGMTLYDVKSSRKLFDMRAFSKEVRKRTMIMRNAKKLVGDFNLILSADVIETLFDYFLLPAVNGKAVFENRSPLAGQLGRKIASESLNLIEEPLIDYRPSSSFADDEGVPCKRKFLIKEGLLNTFLFNIETAAETSEKTTGNGFKYKFSKPPGIGLTNLLCESNEVQDIPSKAVLIKSIMGLHNANRSSGDFSIQLREAYILNKGEIGRGVISSEWRGNFFDILKQVNLVEMYEVGSYYQGPLWQIKGKLL